MELLVRPVLHHMTGDKRFKTVRMPGITERELVQAFPETDVILLEGLKDSPYPKYICRYPEIVPDIDAIAHMIERNIMKKRSGRWKELFYKDTERFLREAGREEQKEQLLLYLYVSFAAELHEEYKRQGIEESSGQPPRTGSSRHFL